MFPNRRSIPCQMPWEDHLAPHLLDKWLAGLEEKGPSCPRACPERGLEDPYGIPGNRRLLYPTDFVRITAKASLAVKACPSRGPCWRDR